MVNYISKAMRSANPMPMHQAMTVGESPAEEKKEAAPPKPQAMKQPAKALCAALAGTFNLYFCAHSYHWNVTGSTFPSLHKLFGDIYEDAHDAVDALAERLRTLDVMAPRSLAELTMEETEVADAEDAIEMVKDLEEENAALIETLNEAFAQATKANKLGLANFLQDRIDKHEKWGWMLRATAEG